MYLNFINHKIWNCIKVLLYSSSFFVFSSSLPAAQYKPLPVDGDGKLAPNSKFVSANGIVTASNLGKFRQDFRLFIDTTQSTRDNGYTTKTRTNTNIFYYKDASGNLVRTVNSMGNSMPSFTTYSYVPDIQYWTDCEIKGTDKWNNLGFFTSTIALNNSQVAALHPQITDKTPKIYYWETAWQNSTGGCWGQRGQLTDFNYSIGAQRSSGSCVSAIWIYPSLDSKEQRAVPVYNGPNTLDTANYPKKGKGDNSSAANLAAGYKWVVWGDYVREFLSNPDNTILCWRQTTTYGETYNGYKIWRPVRVEFYGDFKEIK